MNWLESLAETYDRQRQHIGKIKPKPIKFWNKKGIEETVFKKVTPLLPLYHGIQNAHITVTLDTDGNFRSVIVNDPDDLMTIIPVTEDSESRSSGLAPHPLCDKLQYIAGDAVRYFVPAASDKKRVKQLKDLSDAYELYIEQLEAWRAHDPGNPMLTAVLTYVKRGILIEDLVKAGILLLDVHTGHLLEKWPGDSKSEPSIFGLVKPGTQESAFVRWEIEEMSAVQRQALQDSWSSYAPTLLKSRGTCYVTGQVGTLSSKFPKRIRNAGDGAKIISSNDSEGYTYRGRFIKAEEAFGLSSVVSFKAHSALRWLLSKQGYADGDQSILVWSPEELRVPQPWEASDLWADEQEDAAPQPDTISTGKTGDSIADLFRRGLRGDPGRDPEKEFRELLAGKMVYLIALDSATPGRLSVTRYMEFPASDYLVSLLQWHRRTYWKQKRQYGAKEKGAFYDGSPSLRMIITSAYGKDVDDKLRKFTMSRLLPCTLQNAPIPRDIEIKCVLRASKRHAFPSRWDWESVLGVACSVYLYNHNQREQRPYTMQLDKQRTTRGYLYGRLWAVAEAIESEALQLLKTDRPTNAERLMQQFQQRPHATWVQMEATCLPPYLLVIHKNKPDWHTRYNKILDETMALYEANDFLSSSPLDGEFLLGYHNQRAAIYAKKEQASKESDSEQ